MISRSMLRLPEPLFIYSRLLLGAHNSEDEDRFRVLLGEVSTVSEAAGQLQFRVRALEDSRLVDRCELLEEKEGRINSESLNHLIIKGRNIPYLEKGDDLQQRLKAQVRFKEWLFKVI